MFKVGEIAELRDIPFPMSRLNGEECEVIAPLEPRVVRNLLRVEELMVCYVIRLRDGHVCAAIPSQLKKKKNPPEADASERNSIVSWEDCAWKPAEELV